eukprot:1331670-Amorphochlora_amoeboformis.AAC.1
MFQVVVMGASSAFFHVTLSQRAKGWEEMAMVWTAFGWLCVLTQMSNSSTVRHVQPIIIAQLTLYIPIPERDTVYCHGSISRAGVMDVPAGYSHRPSHLWIEDDTARAILLRNVFLKRLREALLQSRTDRDLGSAAHPSTLKLQLMARWQLACGLLAFLVLVASDMFCTSMCNFQLHALWHLLIGLSCHYGLQFAMALRQSILHKAPPATSWSLGGLLGCVVPTEVPSRAMGAQLRWLLKMAGVDRLDSV